MFYDKLLYLLIHTHTHTHTHTVHRYWPISEIYHTAGQTDIASDMVLTPLLGRRHTWSDLTTNQPRWELLYSLHCWDEGHRVRAGICLHKWCAFLDLKSLMTLKYKNWKKKLQKKREKIVSMTLPLICLFFSPLR